MEGASPAFAHVHDITPASLVLHVALFLPPERPRAARRLSIRIPGLGAGELKGNTLPQGLGKAEGPREARTEISPEAAKGLSSREGCLSLNWLHLNPHPDSTPFAYPSVHAVLGDSHTQASLQAGLKSPCQCQRVRFGFWEG